MRSLALGDPAGFTAGLKARTVIDDVQRAPDLLLAIHYSGEHTLPFGDRLWAIPLAALWQA